MSRRLGSCLAEDLRPCVGLLTVALAVAGHFAPSARADSVAAFYQGKDIKLLISGTVGGGYDIYARTLAKHLGAHIPGHPTVIPQNMIGGGGVVMASHMQTIAAKDGTVIGMMPNTLPMNQMSGMQGARYDIGQFHWIGSMMPPTHSAMVSWHASGVRTIEDARRQEITAGASPKGSFWTGTARREPRPAPPAEQAERAE